MRRPSSYLIDVPSTAGIVLPMENDRTSTCNTAEQNLSALAGDATLTGMGVYDLTITPGTTAPIGYWTRARPWQSGYWFDGAESSMTNATHLLHAKSTISILVWFIPDSTAAGTKILAAAFVDGTHYVALVQSGTTCFATVCDGTTEFKATVTAVTAGHLHAAFLLWDKTANSGKVTCTVYDADTATLTTADSASGCTSDSSADDDFFVGSRDGSTQYYLGTICRVMLDTTTKWTAAQVAQLYLRQATSPSHPSLWELAEQYGTTAYDTGWRSDGPAGRGLYLADSANTYLSVADDADLELAAADFTVALWVYVTTLANAYLLYKNAAMSLYLQADGDLALSVISVGDTDVNTTTGQPISAGAWYAIVVTRTSNVVALYVNGASVALDDTTNDVTMTNNANAWLIGGDGTDGLTGRLGPVLLDPSVSYGAQWAKDFYHGLPGVPVLDEPTDGASTLTVALSDPTGSLADRLAPAQIGTRQLLAWIKDATRAQARFWRGTLRTVSPGTDKALALTAKDPGFLHDDYYDTTYGKVAGTTAVQDLYTTLNAVKEAGISVTHTANPTGQVRAFTIAMGTRIRDLYKEIYDEYGLRGWYDPWGDHWLKTVPKYAGADSWTEATTGWTAANSAVATEATIKIIGSNSLKVTSSAANGRAYRTVAVNADDHRYLIVHVCSSVEIPYVRLYSGGYGSGAYYQHAIPITAASQFCKLILPLPTAQSNYCWTPTGAPDRTALNCLEVGTQNAGTTGTSYWDGLHFTVWDPASAVADEIPGGASLPYSMEDYANFLYGYWNSGGTPTLTVASLAAIGATRELVVSDQAVASATPVTNWLHGMVPTVYDYLRPSGAFSLPWRDDLLNLHRGDVLSITDSTLNVSALKALVTTVRLRPAQAMVDVGFEPRRPAEPRQAEPALRHHRFPDAPPEPAAPDYTSPSGIGYMNLGGRLVHAATLAAMRSGESTRPDELIAQHYRTPENGTQFASREDRIKLTKRFHT